MMRIDLQLIFISRKENLTYKNGKVPEMAKTHAAIVCFRPHGVKIN